MGLDMSSAVHLSPVDLAIIGLYILLTVLAGVMVSRASSRRGAEKGRAPQPHNAPLICTLYIVVAPVLLSSLLLLLCIINAPSGTWSSHTATLLGAACERISSGGTTYPGTSSACPTRAACSTSRGRCGWYPACTFTASSRSGYHGYGPFLTRSSSPRISLSGFVEAVV